MYGLIWGYNTNPISAYRDEYMQGRYTQFIGKLNAKGIALNRKVLADLAMNEPARAAD